MSCASAGGRAGGRKKRKVAEPEPSPAGLVRCREVAGAPGEPVGSPRARGEPSAPELRKLLAQPERVLVEEGIPQVHRRPLVEVTVEHGRCGREGARGVRGSPHLHPHRLPERGRTPARDPAPMRPYPAAEKQKVSAGLRSTRSGWSPATAGSEADRQTDREESGITRASVWGQPAPRLCTGQGRRCRPGEQPPSPKVKRLRGFSRRAGTLKLQTSRSSQIPVNPLPGGCGQHRAAPSPAGQGRGVGMDPRSGGGDGGGCPGAGHGVRAAPLGAGAGAGGGIWGWGRGQGRTQLWERRGRRCLDRARTPDSSWCRLMPAGRQLAPSSERWRVLGINPR